MYQKCKLSERIFTSLNSPLLSAKSSCFFYLCSADPVPRYPACFHANLGRFIGMGTSFDSYSKITCQVLHRSWQVSWNGKPLDGHTFGPEAGKRKRPVFGHVTERNTRVTGRVWHPPLPSSKMRPQGKLSPIKTERMCQK